MSSDTHLNKHSARLENEPIDDRYARHPLPQLALRLDHVILRSPDPAATLAALEGIGPVGW